ncbi:MAG: OmpA family protein [Candidatus Zixiibacteriota bacterium]|nr:MAG: OmpA family protein [candidate division Zixibacteria bacterium]
MRLKVLLTLTVVAAFLIAGCASKGYVDQKMAEVQARMDADMNTVKAQSSMNADEINKLKALSNELSEKADLALNEAKGFENYRIIWEGVVNFDFDSYDLTQTAKDNLEDLGQKMIDYPRSLLELAGHTDQMGSSDYNFTLGQKRAESVKKYLVDQYAVALYRMFTVSHGETRPVAMPDEQNAYSKNRRVVLKLYGQL